MFIAIVFLGSFLFFSDTRYVSKLVYLKKSCKDRKLAVNYIRPSMYFHAEDKYTFFIIFTYVLSKALILDLSKPE